MSSLGPVRSYCQNVKRVGSVSRFAPRAQEKTLVKETFVLTYAWDPHFHWGDSAGGLVTLMISNIKKNKMEGLGGSKSLGATFRHRGIKSGTLTIDTEYPHTTKHALPTIVIHTKIKKESRLINDI